MTYIISLLKSAYFNWWYWCRHHIWPLALCNPCTKTSLWNIMEKPTDMMCSFHIMGKRYAIVKVFIWPTHCKGWRWPGQSHISHYTIMSNLGLTRTIPQLVIDPVIGQWWQGRSLVYLRMTPSYSHHCIIHAPSCSLLKFAGTEAGAIISHLYHKFHNTDQLWFLYLSHILVVVKLVMNTKFHLLSIFGGIGVHIGYRVGHLWRCHPFCCQRMHPLLHNQLVGSFNWFQMRGDL